MLFHSFSVLVFDHFHRNALFVGLRNTGSSFDILQVHDVPVTKTHQLFRFFKPVRNISNV